MIRKLARPMLASVYLVDGIDTVSNTEAHVEGTEAVLNRLKAVVPREYANQIPEDPEVVAKGVGAAKIASASLLALGKMPRLSAATLALLEIPTILARHAFWETQEPHVKRQRRSGFLTSVALLGGLFITSADTAGKPSLAWRAKKALPGKSDAERYGEAVQARAASFADSASTRAGELAETASDRASEFADVASEHAGSFAETAKGLFEDAREYFEDNKDDWLAMAQSNAKAAKKKAVKVAVKAQQRADDATANASKKAGKYQKRADKAVAKAQKKLSKKFDF